MSGRQFGHLVEGTDVSTAFEMLRYEYRRRHGDDYYSGTIGMCDRCRVTKTFQKFNEKNIAEAEKMASLCDSDNGLANCVDLGVKYYSIVKTSFKKMKNTAKYTKKYAVCDCRGVVEPRHRHIFTNHEQAKQDAIKLCTLGYSDIEIRKIPVKESGSETTDRVSVEMTKSTRPQKNTKTKHCVPIHAYYFYGWAAE